MLSLLIAMLTGMDDKKITDLNDGYVRVETKSYSIDLPKGWSVSDETPWGQRKAKPQTGAGELGIMTAPPSEADWDSLYDTALYFVMREEKGEATPYKIVKTESGFEACQFAVKDEEGFASRRFVMVKHPEKGLLALSVRVPSKEADKQWQAHFDRMVKSAQFN